jgi:hypothetical protein
MCRVQQSVYFPIPVTDGYEGNVVVVVSNRNSESKAKKRGRGDCCSFRAGLLLGAWILTLLLPGSPCACSFHSGQHDQSKGDAFLRGTEVTYFYQDSPQKINAQLRYAPLRPISPEASSKESPSKDIYELQRYGSSLSYPSKDGVRTVLETDKSSDSIDASERASLEHDGRWDSIASKDADFTPKAISSEDASKSRHNNDPVISSPMIGRRSIIDLSKDLLRQS